jgi:hypothetical protein
MQTSENINELATALAKAQGSLEGAKKDSANPHFKSKYADLASVWDACRDALSKNSLSVVQLPGECADGKIEMTTMLLHSSGQWISERLTIPLAKVDAQGYGSAVTYARRYALAAAVGIAPEDDDGNAAVAGKGAANGPREARINDDQLNRLQNAADEVGADLQKFCGYLKINSLPELAASRFDAAMDALQAKQKKAA